MGDIVNLRLFKKKKQRQDKDVLSHEKRQVHGQTKTEKQFNKRKQQETQQFLSLNRLTGDLQGDDEK